MGFGRIAALFGFSATETDGAASSTSGTSESGEAGAEPSSSGSRSFLPYQQHVDPDQLVAQLHTVISSVRQLNDFAARQGAALSVSSAGNQLRNAVGCLGNLLSTTDARVLENNAIPQLQEAETVISSVETTINNVRAAAETMIASLPEPQASRARDASEAFQTAMTVSIGQVRGSLTPILHSANA